VSKYPFLRAFLIPRIAFLLGGQLEERKYDVLMGEVGLDVKEGEHLIGDIFIFKSKDLVIDTKCANIPPYIAIEVDVKIDLEKDSDKEYVFTKIKKYLDFGVSKVIWIFTETQHIIIATPNEEWIITNLDKKIVITDTCTLCVQDVLSILKEKGIRF
jgi:hypothetical protein